MTYSASFQGDAEDFKAGDAALPAFSHGYADREEQIAKKAMRAAEGVAKLMGGHVSVSVYGSDAGLETGPGQEVTIRVSSVVVPPAAPDSDDGA